MNMIPYLLLGLTAGAFGGALGLGGGAIMVPAFVLIFGMTQHQAQGTTLAVMLPPVFIMAVLRYYKEGLINVPVAVYVALGFTLGAMIGAHCVQGVPDIHLRRAFGVFVIFVGIKMLLAR